MSKGKEKLKESLSALMDNEASEFEFRRVLKECAVNDDLKLKWERFHLISAAIRGEIDNSINAGIPGMNEKAENSEQKRPDLLSRINTELDGIDGGNSASSSHNKFDGNTSAIRNQSGYLRLLGQGAIAASVAAIVFIAGGTLNPTVPLGTELQFAELSEISESSVPEFNDAFSPSEFSFVPQIYTEFAGTESLDEAARVRLRQAVFQEFVGETPESVELPVNFNVIIEE